MSVRMPWLRRRQTAPVAIPLEPGFTVTAKGQEFVILTVTYSAPGELTLELLRRDEWDRRYTIR